MQTIINNDEKKISITGKDYDFIATVENKTDEKIKIVFDEDETYYIEVEPKNWIGLLADDTGYDMLNCFKNNNYEVLYEN